MGGLAREFFECDDGKRLYAAMPDYNETLANLRPTQRLNTNGSIVKRLQSRKRRKKPCTEGFGRSDFFCEIV